MFMGSYEFDGEPEALIPAYERLLAGYPPDALDLHVCVVGTHSITVYDACPSREVFTAFSASPEFAAALAGAGLPVPRVNPIGEVHVARLRTAVGA